MRQPGAEGGTGEDADGRVSFVLQPVCRKTFKKRENPVVICHYLGYNRINLKCTTKSCYFEPTDTLNGILILPYRCQASGFRPYAVEDRSMVAVTHLALLGVKIQDPAFWGSTKDKKQSFYTAAFVLV